MEWHNSVEAPGVSVKVDETKVVDDSVVDVSSTELKHQLIKLFEQSQICFLNILYKPGSPWCVTLIKVIDSDVDVAVKAVDVSVDDSVKVEAGVNVLRKSKFQLMIIQFKPWCVRQS